MRFNKDHMKNDRLLPGYDLQMVVCDEYIAHYGVYAYASSTTSDIMKRRPPFSGILRLFAGCFFTTPFLQS